MIVDNRGGAGGNIAAEAVARSGAYTRGEHDKWAKVVKAVGIRVERALAVTGAKRSPTAAHLPTMIESGFPNFEVRSRTDMSMTASARSKEIIDCQTIMNAERNGNGPADRKIGAVCR